MNRRNALKLGVSALAGLYLSPLLGQSHILNTPAFKGTFEPTWDSLKQISSSRLVSRCKIWNVGTLGTSM